MNLPTFETSLLSPGMDSTILIVLDSSSSVGDTAYVQLKKIVLQFFEVIRDARVGLISITCPPKLAVPIGTHTFEEFQNLVREMMYGGKTEMYDALDMARTLLDRETSDYKTLIIITDSGERTRTQCFSTKYREDEFDVAEE
ncbi:hypothetical protein COOONC_21276, partial [Cooperia oncophora]